MSVIDIDVISDDTTVTVVAEIGDEGVIVSEQETSVVIVNDLYPSLQASREVNVVTDFGAKHDGTEDVSDAIEEANKYLESIGGGRMFFPAGDYNMPNFGKQIRVRSNVEYVGEGYATHIIGTNCAFNSGSDGNNVFFNRPFFEGFTYYDLTGTIAENDNSVTLGTPGDYVNFAVGDYVMIRSEAAVNATTDDTLPYFIEINRVLAISDTGEITLEDCIADKYEAALIVANVTKYITANFSIHNMRISNNDGEGSPFFLCAAYKARIYDLWLEGYYGAAWGNACVRCSWYDIMADFEDANSAIEIEVGSAHCDIHDVVIRCHRHSGVNPAIYLQEWSRRTTIKDVVIEIYGPSTNAVSGLFSIQHKGHVLENVKIKCATVQKIGSYWGLGAQWNDLGVRMRNVVIDCESWDYGLTLFSDNTLKNIDVEGFLVTGEPTLALTNQPPLLAFYGGNFQDCIFSKLRCPGGGYVWADQSPLIIDAQQTPPYSPLAADAPTMVMTNVVLRDCEFDRLYSLRLHDDLTLVGHNKTRLGRVPRARHVIETLSSGVANDSGWAPLGVFTVPADTLFLGDLIRVRVNGWWDGYRTAPAHVKVEAFGDVIYELVLPDGEAAQNFLIDIEFTMSFPSDGLFWRPQHYAATGTVIKANAMKTDFLPFFGNVNYGGDSSIAVYVWTEANGEYVLGKGASIEMIPIERRKELPA